MNDEQMVNVVGALAVHFADLIREATDRAAEHGAASPTALVTIYQYPDQTIDYVRKILGLSHSGTVRLIDRLVDRGLVARGSASDGRSVALRCTSQGVKRVKLIFGARRRIVEPLIEILSAAEKAHLHPILKKFAYVARITESEGLGTCRLCEFSTCYWKNSCPVTHALDSDSRTFPLDGGLKAIGKAKLPLRSQSRTKVAVQKRPKR